MNPDAHSIAELDLLKWGVAVARKGGVPKDKCSTRPWTTSSRFFGSATSESADLITTEERVSRKKRGAG
jgi:hypothetical protein